MSDHIMPNPAEEAAEKALQKLYDCLHQNKSFVFEAAAGAGKTYSLVKGLQFLLERKGRNLIRRKQRIACITFTNVAKDEIRARTFSNPAVMAETIHAFCWYMLKNFQEDLRRVLPSIGKWSDRINEYGSIEFKPIEYDLGYPRIDEDKVSIGHDDVLRLMVKIMEKPKFRAIFSNRFPIVFIDEYQDTDKDFVETLLKYFVETGEGPMVAFFGDHWQKIYANNPCGLIQHPGLEIIEKKANFRSDRAIVEALNRMRVEHQQEFFDPNSGGSVTVFHTNNWSGTRRDDRNWKGDLPSDVSHQYLQHVIDQLSENGWDFTSGKTTKTLMLTHKVLAYEQGYENIDDFFSKNRDAFTKKEDPYISFFVDVLEPVCTAYEERRFGDMFTALAQKTPIIRNHADKAAWLESMAGLLAVRQNGTIGHVIEYLQESNGPKLSETLQRMEKNYEAWLRLPEDQRSENDNKRFGRLDQFKEIRYGEVIAVKNFLDEGSIFATKHGVKGAEFENVVVVFGRGWNLYDFGKMLEWIHDQGTGYSQDTYERNRNLYYVACSRARKRLALLFTQELKPSAISTLAKWYGPESIQALPDLG